MAENDTQDPMERIVQNSQKDSQDHSRKQVSNTEENRAGEEMISEASKFPKDAEKVPSEFLPELAKLKRDINGDLDQENLVYAVGEESLKARVGNQLVPMLLVRLANGAPVYIPVTEAGTNYRHLDSFIGRTFKIAISTLDDAGTFDNEHRPEYVALGSIRQAEFVIGGQLYQQHEQDPDKFKDETRQGTIYSVIDTPGLQLVFISYKGMGLPMYAQQYDYMSYTRPLPSIAHIGDKVKFKISRIERVKYEDMKKVEEDINQGHLTPKGLRYLIWTTALPFKKSPNERVKRLEKTHSAFLAHIVRYNPVTGIWVEIAPGWWIKAYLSSRAPYQPTFKDEVEHTPVIVQIEPGTIDEKKRHGRCTILGFPQGVARTIPDI